MKTQFWEFEDIPGPTDWTVRPLENAKANVSDIHFDYKLDSQDLPDALDYYHRDILGGAATLSIHGFSNHNPTISIAFPMLESLQWLPGAPAVVRVTLILHSRDEVISSPPLFSFDMSPLLDFTENMVIKNFYYNKYLMVLGASFKGFMRKIRDVAPIVSIQGILYFPPDKGTDVRKATMMGSIEIVANHTQAHDVNPKVRYENLIRREYKRRIDERLFGDIDVSHQMSVGESSGNSQIEGLLADAIEDEPF